MIVPRTVEDKNFSFIFFKRRSRTDSVTKRAGEVVACVAGGIVWVREFWRRSRVPKKGSRDNGFAAKFHSTATKQYRQLRRLVKSRCIKLYRAYVISFNSSNLGIFFQIGILKTVSKFRKRKRKLLCCVYVLQIGHFTVMDGSEGEGDLVLIQTFFVLLWKLFLKNTSYQSPLLNGCLK